MQLSHPPATFQKWREALAGNLSEHGLKCVTTVRNQFALVCTNTSRTVFSHHLHLVHQLCLWPFSQTVSHLVRKPEGIYQLVSHLVIEIAIYLRFPRLLLLSAHWTELCTRRRAYRRRTHGTVMAVPGFPWISHVLECSGLTWFNSMTWACLPSGKLT